MSVYSDVLQAVVNLINTETQQTVVIGPLPPDNGVSIAWASNAYNSFMSRNATVDMTAVLNSKDTSQQAAMDVLGEIHTTISNMKNFPSADNYQITDITTATGPNYIGREENNQWLYGSSLRVKFFIRGY